MGPRVQIPVRRVYLDAVFDVVRGGFCLGIREVLYSEFFRAYANPDAQVFVLTKTENVKRW